MSVLPFPSSQALCTLRATFCCCNILATQITNIWYAPLSPNPQSSTISRNEIDNCLTISRVQQPKAAKKCYVSFLVRSVAFCPFIGCFLYYNKMWTRVKKYKYNVCTPQISSSSQGFCPLRGDAFVLRSTHLPACSPLPPSVGVFICRLISCICICIWFICICHFIWCILFVFVALFGVFVFVFVVGVFVFVFGIFVFVALFVS